MKVSEINQSVICNYCRIVEDDLNETDTTVLTALQTAAVNYCTGYTGLSEDELDEHEDITIAVLVLIGDMYDNRQMYVDKSNINRTADAILGMHCVNWIPEEVEEVEEDADS